MRGTEKGETYVNQMVMSEQGIGQTAELPQRYYEKLGQACDAIVRCRNCQRLCTHAEITKGPGCPRCGTKYVTEVTSLSFREWLRIRLGLLTFPYRREFLAEFSPWGGRR
jgi:uncharacterized paraquat-inducible protein A